MMATQLRLLFAQRCYGALRKPKIRPIRRRWGAGKGSFE